MMFGSLLQHYPRACREKRRMPDSGVGVAGLGFVWLPLSSSMPACAACCLSALLRWAQSWIVGTPCTDIHRKARLDPFWPGFTGFCYRVGFRGFVTATLLARWSLLTQDVFYCSPFGLVVRFDPGWLLLASVISFPAQVFGTWERGRGLMVSWPNLGGVMFSEGATCLATFQVRL
jgi:hypothetical protein